MKKVKSSRQDKLKITIFTLTKKSNSTKKSIKKIIQKELISYIYFKAKSIFIRDFVIKLTRRSKIATKWIIKRDFLILGYAANWFFDLFMKT